MAISSFSRSGLARVVSPDAADFSNAATGTYTSDGVSYKYVTFTGNGTLTITDAGYADVLVVGSGGGGQAATFSAGGGGGAVRFGAFYLAVNSYTVTVGSGGASATNGNDSSLDTILKCGGGQRGHSVASPTNFGKITPGGGGSPGGTTMGNYGNAAGSGAGGATYATNHYDPISIDYTGAATDYAKGGQTGTTGAANTGNGGYGSNAGGSGVVIVRVRTN